MLDLLLHPVRLRIVNAMAGGRIRTTSDLCARLPDVPKTSLYRQVALLAEGGVLEVTEEKRVHGAVERHFRLRRTEIKPEAGAAMSLEEHRRGFAASMAALLAEFNTYLDQEGANPYADSVSYRQGAVWLSPEDLGALLETMRAALLERARLAPSPGRRPYLLSTIFFPLAEDPD